MGNIRDIDPYELLTIQECDDALAFVEQELIDIEDQLSNAPDEATIGWARKAKGALKSGTMLKQRIQNRRGDLNREIKQQWQLQREKDMNQIFVNICKQTLPKEQIQELWKKVEDFRNEYSEKEK